MITLRDKESYASMFTLVAIKNPKDTVVRSIEYNGGDDLIRNINIHEAFLIGRTCDDDHITLFFPSMLSNIESSLFFDLPLTSIIS